MVNSLMNILFPNRCLDCNTIIPPDEIVCELCFSKIDFTHFDYHGNHSFRDKCSLLFPVERAFALMYFKEQNLARKIIHALKYKGRAKLGLKIADWTIPRIDFKDNKPDLLVSVPLHSKRLQTRGYNQLHLFTEKIAQHFEIPFNHCVFKRDFNTKAQALRNKISRQKNQGLFSFDQKVSNQHILLIDDVFTTGTTLSNLAWQLIEQNNTVSILVMALDN
ncbi:MAG: phosphoribosyltransferase [Flavobacteriales bacterium]|nr:MAG: phosphoribosyltransferase [Flavobacteriales bacterium]